MITLNRILVPTDFSETSAAAVRYGVALAQSFSAELHLLHAEVRHDLEMIVERQRAVETIVAEMEHTESAPGLDEIAQHAARELLAPSLTEQEQSSLRVEYVLRASGRGGPGDIDLIVMGTHGRGFMAHMLIGSVAEKVVRHAPCPVLTVRHPEHEFVTPD
jgi:nucleotide-binding universal stress UspA family protein